MANTQNGQDISPPPRLAERPGQTVTTDPLRPPVNAAVEEATGSHYSPEQLAEREGVPVATVYQWRLKGTGPPGFRVGRHVRYRLSDVIAWEEEQIAAGRSAS